MGLDIYLYKVKKNDSLKENETYKRDDINIKHLVTIEKDSKNICKTIIDNSTIINIIDKFFSVDLVGKYAKVEGAKSICCVGSFYSSKNSMECFEIYDENDNMIGYVEIPEKDWESVSEEKTYEYYAFELIKIDYQRKGLDDYGWEHLPNNCSYCDEKTVIKEMVKGGLARRFLNKFEKGNTVLMCWW